MIPVFKPVQPTPLTAEEKQALHFQEKEARRQAFLEKARAVSKQHAPPKESFCDYFCRWEEDPKVRARDPYLSCYLAAQVRRLIARHHPRTEFLESVRSRHGVFQLRIKGRGVFEAPAAGWVRSLLEVIPDPR